MGLCRNLSTFSLSTRSAINELPASDWNRFVELTAAKRNKIKRERRRVGDADIEFRVLHGGDLAEDEWALYPILYRDTFDKQGHP